MHGLRWTVSGQVKAHVVLTCTQMGSRPITFLWLWPATDHEQHCPRVPIDKIRRRTESTPRSGRWRSHMAGIYGDCSTREINNRLEYSGVMLTVCGGMLCCRHCVRRQPWSVGNPRQESDTEEGIFHRTNRRRRRSVICINVNNNTVSQNNKTPNSWPQLPQMSTDFHNSFADRLTGKSGTNTHTPV